MEMNVTLDNLGGLYALQDRYTELTHRYHRMKERGKFVKMTVALPCRLARKLVKYRVIVCTKDWDSCHGLAEVPTL